MTRLYLTAREHDALLDAQDGICTICGEILEGPTEADHSTPHFFRPDRKPDQIVHRRCHRKKTAERDVPAIAKVKRLIAKKGPRLHATLKSGRKMQSRGFDKRWSRRFDGSVVRREAAMTGR